MISMGFSLEACLEMSIRLIVACACGALIGLEREKRYKDAGLRTHIIVCCSAALLMIVSKYGFNDLFVNGEYILGTKGTDPSRIAAQVISGVSFIGAGVIFHNKNNTRGLTTASGLWAIAGVGIAIGAGMYEIGIFATVLIAIIQTIIHKTVGPLGAITVANIEIVANNSERIRNKVKEYIDENIISIKEEKVKIDGDTITYRLTVNMGKNITADVINQFFEQDDDIKSVSFAVLS